MGQRHSLTPALEYKVPALLIPLLGYVRSTPTLTTIGHPDLIRAIKRYNAFVYYKSRKELILEIPADIAWLWYIHSTYPVAFADDCKKAFGHRLSLCGKNIWNAVTITAPFENIRFDTPLDTQPSFTFVTSIDLEAKAAHHVKYVHMFSSYTKKTESITAHMSEYRTFLELSKKCVKQSGEVFLDPAPLVPTVGISLIWHTHMMLAECYLTDTHLCFGLYRFNYDHDHLLLECDVNAETRSMVETTRQTWRKYTKQDYPERNAGDEYFPSRLLRSGSSFVAMSKSNSGVFIKGLEAANIEQALSAVEAV